MIGKTELRPYAEANNVTTAWPTLPDATSPLPDFPVNALPDMAARYCVELSASIQVDPAMVAASVFGLVSAATVGRITVKAERNNSHTEPIQLYILCRADSGERKSATLSAVKQPLEEWLNGERAKKKAQNAEVVLDLKVCEKKMKQAQDKDYKSLLRQKAELESKIEKEPIFLLSDVTLEAMTTFMEEHEGKAVVLSDEAHFLNVLCGKSYLKDGTASNLDAVLQGYDNGAAKGLRIGRASWNIPKASLSLCLGVQPSLLETFVRDPQGNGRGLQGRFLYFLPPSLYGLRKASGPEVTHTCTSWWKSTICRLAGAPESVLEFDTDSEDAYIEWFNYIESIKLSDFDDELRPWAGKLVGNTIRLAGILALLDGAEQVRLAHWHAASHIAETYLIPCAKRVFCGADTELSSAARLIREKIESLVTVKKKERDRFTLAELREKRLRSLISRGRLDDKRIESAMAELQKHGYIRPAANQPQNDVGRPSSILYNINPYLLENTGERKEVYRL